MNDATTGTRHLTAVPTPAAPVMCSEHRAYEADYCPACGTARVIGQY